MTNDRRLCTGSRDFWKSYTRFAKKCRVSATTTSTCLRRWFAPGSVPEPFRQETVATFARRHPSLIAKTQRRGQDKGMTRTSYTVMLLTIVLTTFSHARAATSHGQGKTVLLDVPSIAERVNEVVVN